MPQKHRRRASLSASVPEPKRTNRPALFVVGPSDRLPPGSSMKFRMPIRGVEEECFVINFRGEFRAYVNRCRHVPMAMDWVENQFFAEQGRYLMCQTHNAYYEPDSGECIAGPPGVCGKALYRVPLTVRRGLIYARAPETEFDD